MNRQQISGAQRCDAKLVRTRSHVLLLFYTVTSDIVNYLL